MYEYDGPKVEMTFEEFGRDGNTMAILSTVTRAMKDQLDLSREEIDVLVKECREAALSGDYQNALCVLSAHVDFIEEEMCEECGQGYDVCDCDDRCPDCRELECECA